MIIDTHAHYDEDRFAEDLPEILAGFPAAGVRWAVNVGASWQGCLDSVRLAHEYDCLWAAVGLHPDDIADLTEDHIAWMREAANDPKVVAIGEIGLDYHWEDNPPREWQQKVCEDQIELAWRLGLPAAFHVRDAHADMLELLKRHRTHLSGGIMHCFSGSWELAEEYLKLGYCISFAGPVTFKNARKLQEVAVKTPLDRILIETDSPYMAPEPMRGKRNEPTFVRYVCARIAELRGLTLEEVADATTANARRVYGV